MKDVDNKQLFFDEEGNEHEFEIIEVFEVEDKEYAILKAVKDEQALLLRVEYDEKGESVLRVIENDFEFNKVKQLYLSSNDKS